MGPIRPLWEQPYALTTLLTGVLATLLAVVSHPGRGTTFTVRLPVSGP